MKQKLEFFVSRFKRRDPEISPFSSRPADKHHGCGDSNDEITAELVPSGKQKTMERSTIFDG